MSAPKVITEEYLEKERIRGRNKYYKNRDKYLAKGKEYINSKQGFDKLLRRIYSITIEDYNLIFEKQNGCCSICKKHQSELNRKLDVDHDHQTGKVRGLLCHKCNRGLGYFQDNEEYLKQAAEYIKSTKWNY